MLLECWIISGNGRNVWSEELQLRTRVKSWTIMEEAKYLFINHFKFVRFGDKSLAPQTAKSKRAMIRPFLLWSIYFNRSTKLSIWVKFFLNLSNLNIRQNRAQCKILTQSGPSGLMFFFPSWRYLEKPAKIWNHFNLGLSMGEEKISLKKTKLFVINIFLNSSEKGQSFFFNSVNMAIFPKKNYNNCPAAATTSSKLYNLRQLKGFRP